MAQGSAYPAEIVDANGNVTEGVTLQFTDDTNQPGASGSIGPVVVTGTPAAGDELLATGAAAAEWVPASRLFVQVNTSGPLGSVQAADVVDYFHPAASTLTTPAQTLGAGGTITYAITVENAPDISDTLDITYTLYITDPAGTNTGIVTGGTSTTTPAGAFNVDFTGTSATIVGMDLTWDGTTGTFTTAAGGHFAAMLFAGTSPD